MRLSLPGAPERKKLDAIQARIATLKAEDKQIEKQGPSEQETLAQHSREVRQFVDAHPHVSVDVTGSPLELPHASAQRVMAMLVAVVGEQRVVDILMSQRKASGKPFGMGAEQRTKRKREIAETLREQCILEELETLRLEAQGFTVIRRRDIDGRLVLEVWAEQLGEAAA
jgi:hypothetical protein